ncbi:MAG: integrase [Leptothrix sp. (in: Bacteria)]|nr:integrase [Leptothrix sp. (in: b-proteobacteria)]
MDTAQHPRVIEVDWLAASPIGPHATAFKRHLTERRYAAHTIASYVAEVTHFARWVCTRRLPLARVDEVSVAIFLDDHLPSCACTGHTRHDRADHSAALGHLLVVLRAQGAIAHPPVSTTPVDEELRRCDDHMDRVRGLAPKSRTMVLRIVGRLLVERFAGNAVDIAAITPEHVRRFYAEQAALHSKPAGAGSVVSSLRGYFRYRASLGDLVHGLIGALAYPANWALSSLPKKLTDEEVAQLVGSLNNRCRAMRRACAIVRCALDLGLRSIEVAQLSLDDIDWHAGTITLRYTKGRRVDILPLPVATGEAIARYLELERPKTSNRAIFVRNVAPRDAPIGADLIRITIRQAYARAGLPYTRSHLLRHTMANRLLASGSSLKEVADVLRHRSLNTTMIYAKLDSRSLAAVALPWPGSAL